MTGPLPIAADSDQLRRPAFKPFETHVRDAHQNLEHDAGPPPKVKARAQIDSVVNQALPGPYEVLVAMGEGFGGLTEGDQNKVHDLAALVEAAESSITDVGTNAFGGPNTHPVV